MWFSSWLAPRYTLSDLQDNKQTQYHYTGPKSPSFCNVYLPSLKYLLRVSLKFRELFTNTFLCVSSIYKKTKAAYIATQYITQPLQQVSMCIISIEHILAFIVHVHRCVFFWCKLAHAQVHVLLYEKCVRNGGCTLTVVLHST